MIVLITGATGLVGTALTKLLLSKGHTVNYLTTNKSKIQLKTNYKGFYWNVNTQEININCFNNVDVIIHLAGASVAKRWTKKHKKAVLDSRVKSTRLLIESLKKINHNVKHVISASAIGIYPNSLTQNYNEDYPDVDNSFLGNVVNAWETEVTMFKKLSIKVSKIRIGLVLANQNSALQQMLKPIKMLIGAPLGNGKQWQSWIHIQDLVNVFLYVLEYKLEGVYNAVAPNPTTNKALTKQLAKAVKKPLFLPAIPVFVLKLLLGEMHYILVSSQKVSSKIIIKKGFEFKFKTLDNTLVNLLKN